MFGRLVPEVAREVLALSPREYAMIENPQTDKVALDNLYGIDTGNTGPGSIQDVEVFLQQTALDRKTLNELIFLDLSDAEIQDCLGQLSPGDISDIEFAQAQVRNFAEIQRAALRDVERETL